MWLFQKKNHLPSSSSLKGQDPLHQLEPGSNCRICPATNLHRGVHLSQSHGPLEEVHQGVCMHNTAPKWVSQQGRGQQVVRVGVAYQGCHGSFWSIEAGMHDHSHYGCFLTTQNCSCWRLMQCCWRSRQMGSITPLPMAAGPWCHMRRAITQPNASFWHSNGQLQTMLKSTCPTSHLWCGWIITHLCT